MKLYGKDEMKLTKLFHDFFESEKTGGIILIFCTIISLLLSNSYLQSNYNELWNIEFGHHSVKHWINDGLMSIFFLLIGLELEREIYVGELSRIKNASLPIFAALGGMIIPAGIYLLFNYGSAVESGFGIPMATDIAFAIGILSLVGNKVPLPLKVFLTALAVIDDLGAIIIIAVFYTKTISIINLGILLGIFSFLLVLNRLKIYHLIPYLLGGIAMWYFMSLSGIHTTITGILLAFAIPFGDGSEKSPSYILQYMLHKPVAFLILPLFALANTSININSNWQEIFMQSSNLGIIVGLIVGKPLGIFLFSYLAVAIGICSLPKKVNWTQILGVGILGGIGFTMSIFITLLAFDQTQQINDAKMAIIIASVISATVGFIWLKINFKSKSLFLK